MGVLKDTVSALLVDATPEERSRVLRLLFRIIVSVHVMWACGLLLPFGLPGFVFADDVDQKIDEKIEPMQTQLGAIAQQIAIEAARSKNRDDEIDHGLKLIRIDQLATKMRDLKRTHCKGDLASRDVLETEIERAQQEYVSLTGGRYPLPSCIDL